MGKSDRSSGEKAEGTTDARIVRSRAALIRAGRTLLNKNYEASFSDIASAANVGRATFYRLFDTKEDLVRAIALDCLECFDRATEHIESEARSTLDAVRMSYHAMMPLSEEMQFLINLGGFALEDKNLVRTYERQQEEMRELIDQLKREGCVDKTIPTQWLVHSFDAQFYPAWMLRSDPKYTDAELADLAYRSFCRGAGVPTEPAES